jgi:hypothetical protein
MLTALYDFQVFVLIILLLWEKRRLIVLFEPAV